MPIRHVYKYKRQKAENTENQRNNQKTDEPLYWPSKEATGHEKEKGWYTWDSVFRHISQTIIDWITNRRNATHLSTARRAYIRGRARMDDWMKDDELTTVILFLIGVVEGMWLGFLIAI